MDLQLRQTNQHIDHEFEWEPYFRLYIQFINIIALVTKWCSTDNVVFIKSMRMLFKKLFEDQKNTGEEFVTRMIGDVSATCIDYQVSSKPVALHQPLTRLLSALSLYMDNFELSFDANELDIMERPTAVQMMEPSLRTVVFVSQVQAGMWRRNGHSLLDQVNTYHEHRWRREMADRDIIMLQLAAANMHPDDFMINLVSKFQLINWSSQEFDFKEDDSIRQINILAEEFLSILIYILAERYIPQVGEVTQEDCTRYSTSCQNISRKKPNYLIFILLGTKSFNFCASHPWLIAHCANPPKIFISAKMVFWTKSLKAWPLSNELTKALSLPTANMNSVRNSFRNTTCSFTVTPAKVKAKPRKPKGIGKKLPTSLKSHPRRNCLSSPSNSCRS